MVSLTYLTNVAFNTPHCWRPHQAHLYVNSTPKGPQLNVQRISVVCNIVLYACKWGVLQGAHFSICKEMKRGWTLLSLTSTITIMLATTLKSSVQPTALPYTPACTYVQHCLLESKQTASKD